MSIAVNLMINIIALSSCVFLLQKLPTRLIILLSLLWILVFNIPFIEWHWSACEYFYALFDAPSIMLTLVCMWWLISFIFSRVFISDSAISPISLCLKHSKIFVQSHRIFPPSMQYVWIILGAFVYAEVLGYGFIDIYHLEFRIFIFLYSILSLISYCLSRLAGYGLILSLISYELGILGQINIINYILDPFLWVGCVFALLWRCGKSIIKNMRGKNGKKVV